MKNKINMRKLIFILIGMFFCVIPIEAKAVTTDYETGFKFFEFDNGKLQDYLDDTYGWLDDYADGVITELPDNTVLNSGDYIGIAVTLKAITSNTEATSFEVHFRYDKDVLEPVVTSDPENSPNIMFIDRRNGGGPFPTNRWEQKSATMGDGVATITFGDNNGTPFVDTQGKPVAVFFMKVKDNVPSARKVKLTFVDENDPVTGEDGGNHYTLGSTYDSENVYVNYVNSESLTTPPLALSDVKTLASISAVNGTDKYIDLSWDNGSTDTTFNGVVPASIDSLTLNIKPFHEAARIVVCPDEACVTTTFNLMASSGIALLSGSDNTLTTTVSGLTTGSNKSYYKVTAENGDEEIYTIDIKKLNDDASLGSVTLTNGITLSYDSATKTYSATNVPYATNKTNISASVTTDSNAVIDSTGTTWSVTDGAILNVEWNLTNTASTVNTGTIKVNAENCDSAYENVPNNTCTTESYTINVTRNAPKTIATLKSLTVGGTLVNGFVPDDATKLEYTLSDTTSATLNIAGVVTDNSNATITSGTGSVNLSVGENTFNIVVTAEDGKTTKTYKIKVKRLSTEASLKTLTVTSSPQGTMGAFASGTKAYTYVFDETVSSVNVNATSTHNEAMISINGEASTKHTASASVTPVDGNSVNIAITAEDGTTTDTYTITFERKKSDVNTLKTLSVKDSDNNEYITNFNSSTKAYNITVPHDVTSLNVSATATSNVAKINNGTNTYTGTMDNLDFTSNSLTLTVSPEEGSDATYTINVTRTKSNNANLTDLKVDGTSIDSFDGTKDGTYTLDDVASSKTSVEITSTLDNEFAKVTITNNGTGVTGNTVNLSEGNNVIVVTVTSQDDTKTITHTINIKKKSSNADLATLNVTSNPQGVLNPSFAPTDITYTYNYDRTVTTIDVAATSSHGATITGTGTYNIPTDTKAELTVTPEDGVIKIYTVNFVQNKDTDSTLSSLTVEDDNQTYTLSPAFSSSIKAYTLTVPTEVERVNVEAIANSLYAKSVTVTKISNTKNVQGTDTIELDPGSNKIEVLVTAEDDTNTKYTLDITRTINTSATLTDLQVDGVTVPDFSSSKTTYNLDAVDYTKEKIEITAIGASGATVTGDGTKSLVPGDNTFEVNVTSQDGNNTAKYTINIRRKLNDAKITNLTSDVGTLNNGSTEFQYTLDIPSGTNNVTLTPTFMTGATLQTPALLTNIDVTNISEIRFTVQAEDTTYTNEYVVILNKLSSTNNNLASLSVDNGTLTPNFNKDTTKYTVSVDSSVDTINVTAVVEDTGKATLTGDGSHSLNYGDNTITVTVTAEDGSTKDYVIIVTRSKSNDTSLSNLTIDGTQIAGFTSTKDTYNISLPFGTTSFVLDATPTDSNASILDSSNKLGTMNLTGDSGTFTFEVEAQDGTKKTYTINVTVAGNNDTSIDSLTVLGKTPIWSDANNRYELTVDGETLKVGPNDILATFGNGASITNKDAEKNLALGGNSYKFTVTAQDGTTTKEVEVYITRDASTINTLDTLTSDVGTITPNFDPDENNYKLTLPEGTTEFTISANPTSKNPTTTVTGTGKYTIPVSGDKVEVIVTAEDGSVNTYEVTIEVEDSVCDLNCDLDGDGVCDLNCDTDGDGKCDLNCDTDGDGKCDINCDTDGDGKCDLNCDTDGDGVCDLNCDTDGDGVCDTNCRLDKITSSIHTIDDDYVLGVRALTKFDDAFKAQFDNEPNELVLYEKDGTTLVTTKNIGTGMILKLERDGKVLDQKEVVVLGDTNGDGKISTNDAVIVVSHALGTTISGSYVLAADTNGDGKISTNDAVIIVSHCLGNSLYKD